MRKEIIVVFLACAMAFSGCKATKSEQQVKNEVEQTNGVVSKTDGIDETEMPNKEESAKENEETSVQEEESKNQEETIESEQIGQEKKNKNKNKKKTETKGEKKENNYKVELKKGTTTADGSFQVNYPQIQDWNNEEAMEQWNKIFRGANYSKENDGVDAYTLKTTVMTKNEKLLSLLFEGTVKYEGIDEVTTFAYTYNIDMKTGKSVQLKDSGVKLAEIEDKLLNENYKIVTKNQSVYMVAVLDELYLKKEKDDDVARIKEALKECDYAEDNSEPACYSYHKNGKVYLVFDVNEAIGGYTIFELK